MSDTHTVKTNALKSWVLDIEHPRMETMNSIIPGTSLLVLNIGERDDLNFWCNKAKKITKTFSSIPDNIGTVLEAPTHIKHEGNFIFWSFPCSLTLAKY